MKLTYYGHSCFLVEAGGKKLLFDPFITPNEQAKHIDITTIEADYILVSHGHEDHVADLVKLAWQTGAKVIASWEIYAWLSNQGLTNLHPMNTGGQFTFDFGRVRCVVAQHSSSLPNGSYAGNPMGFVIHAPEGDFYYSGDTALTLDMELIAHRANLKFAVLPIGSNFTMDAYDAAEAARLCNVVTVVGVHYDTFGYIVIDKDDAITTFEEGGVKLLLPAIGETIDL